MTTNRLIGDSLARTAARTEFAAPVILRAGAGTGKTAALVARIVSWSVGPGWSTAKAQFKGPAEAERIASSVLSGVVAITFTEAAAAEMAERVATAFHALSTSCLVVGLPADALPPDAQVRAQHLLGVIDLLEIRTIHAWCRSLLSQYPLEAGLHPSFVVDADGTRTQRIVRESVEQGLAAVLESDDPVALLHLLGLGVSPAGVERAVATLIEQGVEPDEIDKNPFDYSNLRPYIGILEFKIEHVLSILGDTFDGVRAPNAVKLSRGLQTLKQDLMACDSFDELTECCSTHIPVNLRKHMLKAWVRGDGGRAETDALSPVLQEVRVPAQDLVYLLDEIEGLNPEGYQSAVRVLMPLVADAQARLHSSGVMGFGALLRRAQKLLVRPEVGERVRRRISQLLVDEFQDTDATQCSLIRSLALKGPIAQRPGLFIVGDPKQSIYGWRSADLSAYEGFVEELKGEGAQEYGLIQNFRSVGGILDEVDRCMTRLMTKVPGVQPAYEPLVPARGPGPDKPAIESWVSWAWVEGVPTVPTSVVEARKVEAAALASDLVRLQSSGTKLGSVGVLFRSMTNLDVYQRALRDAGVPYEVTRDRQYFRRTEIVEATAMLRCLLDPLDGIAVLGFLRSSMVQVPDAALMLLWCEKFPKAFMRLGRAEGDVQEAMACIDRVVPMVRSLEEHVAELSMIPMWATHLKDIVGIVARLRKTLPTVSFDRWIQDVRRSLFPDVLGAMAYQGAYRVANLEQFFRGIGGMVTEHRGDLRAVARNLREAVGQQQEAEEARPSEAGDAVLLMTIHKAKGLAFEHTYIVDMHHRIRGSERPTGTLSRGEGLQLLGMWPPGFREYWRRTDEVSRAERIRLLYVAMTRARDRLVFMGAWPGELQEGDRPRMSLDLLASRQPALPNPSVLVHTLGPDETAVEVDNIRWVFPGKKESRTATMRADRAVVDHGVLNVPEGLLEAERARSERRWTQGPSASTEAIEGRRGSLSRADALVVGVALHWVLEHLPVDGPARAYLNDEQLQRALNLAAEGEPVSLPATHRAKALMTSLSGGTLISFFEQIVVLGQEVPLLLRADEDGPVGAWVGSIDLLYRCPDTGGVVVADYKTDQSSGRDSGEVARHHAPQGRLYAEAVQRALDLETLPRFEVWLIESDERVAVPVT